MKTVLFAGGKGTRLSEETQRLPKPLVTIGSHPILWHIMHIYAHYGHKEFGVALGYKGHLIKRYFADYHRLSGDLRVDLGRGSIDVVDAQAPDWVVNLIDTGEDTMTAGRLRRMKYWLGDEPFMVTYGDGVADIDITALIEFHKSHGKLATVTAVRPPARFGAMSFDGERVSAFEEKPQTEQGWINGGFFVFSPGAGNYVFDADEIMLERAPLTRLAADGQLMAFRHEGFWQSMDTLRDRQALEDMWQKNEAKWKTWK